MRCLSAGIYFVGMLVKLRGSLPARGLGSGCSAAVCSRASSRGRGCAAARSAEAVLVPLVPDLCPAVFAGPCRARRGRDEAEQPRLEAGKDERGRLGCRPHLRGEVGTQEAEVGGGRCDHDRQIPGSTELLLGQPPALERSWKRVYSSPAPSTQSCRRPARCRVAAALRGSSWRGTEHTLPASTSVCRCQSKACLAGCNAQARRHAEFPGKHLIVPSRRKTKYHRSGAGFRAACPE